MIFVKKVIHVSIGLGIENHETIIYKIYVYLRITVI